MDLLIPKDPMEMSDLDSTEATHDTPGPSKIKKTEEVHDLDSASMKTASISVDKGGDGREIDGAEVEQNKGEVTLPRDKEDPSKKRKVSPPKPSSRKKSKTSMTKMQTTFVGHYNFLINSNNQVKHKLSTQGSLLFQR